MRILHLGLGAFHRAHQAAYLQRLHELGHREWSIVAGNIRAGYEDVIAALRDQGCAYTLEAVTPDGKRAYQRIESIRAVAPLEDDLATLTRWAADPDTWIVSFTVTEAGYYFDKAGALDVANREVAADLDATRNGRAGHTIYGALAALLRARQASAGGPVTLLCCDNLLANGERSRRGLLEFLAHAGESDLAAWVRSNTTSPNAMVDRITPRAPADLAARVKRATGIEDRAAVMSESFSQWAIEDDFRNGRPRWEEAGVTLTDSVKPWEEAKIRLLNATHSAIAWAGALRGYRYVHEAAVDPAARAIAFDYATRDAMPCLRPSPVDLEAYRDTVLDRFGNAALGDTLERVAADSHAKLGAFVAPTVADRLRAGASIDAVAMLPALYLAFVRACASGRVPWTYVDSSIGEAGVRELAASPDPVQALCGDARVWGEFAGDARLVAAVRAAARRGS